MRKTYHIITIFLLITSIVFILTNPDTTAAESNIYPELSSEAAVLMDAKTGQILFDKNMNKKLYPASITKIMTGIIALEKGNLADTITMSNEAVFSIGRNTSHIALDVGEELTLEQALYALSIESGNDAANGIAEYISGDIEAFARLMNKKALDFGANNTNFVNPHGLPDPDHYTTAYDMALIMMKAIKEPVFTEIFSKQRYEMPPTNLQPETRYFHSSNSLLNGKYKYDEIIASKTGWTSLANHTMVTAARQGNRELIVVVLNNEVSIGKYEDTMKLLDYGFEEFFDVTFDVQDLKTLIPTLHFDNAKSVNIKPDDVIVRLLHNSLTIDDLETSYKIIDNTDCEITVNYFLNLQQPSNFMYESLGEILLTFEIETIKENIENPPQDNPNYFLTGLILVFVLLILIFLIRRRKRPEHFFTSRF
ncbi:D-alanyl-D-alanine carboxypeptidase family protein [Candidatus Contubernalis alkaliaceticus]|uniref:D-alanyl-D-alanine carboxypeptidase family protein n=1 Tax=Candidatus Contubernalis alkaliaceticus TaxID=338645 RepID=UPI001F4C1C21|nr:D-alanyl-D-alanine carboxypeptidase family protein [Candidatus Contubernalis alkalaceticus]UNC93157.1 D-alanyl-D-alanine carboxypeptidase [Candidatus Contubernalis alkalaceticus]